MQKKGYRIEFSALDEIRSAEQEPSAFMDKGIELKKQAKQSFIDAQNKYQNVITLCDKYLPLAKELGDENTIKIITNKRKMANDMAKSLNIDIKSL